MPPHQRQDAVYDQNVELPVFRHLGIFPQINVLAKMGKTPLTNLGFSPQSFTNRLGVQMTMREKLIEDAEAFCRTNGGSLTTLGNTVANDGKFFSRLARGGDCTTSVYERFQAYFRDHGGVAAPPPRAA